ncbi:MAG TPA: NAD(P)/FAD-dependent oxidoreductase [Candidatus Ruania gallistercoris]|uniref:NAD(P)/FAD-dependent oxidoreductase n=1 Tax=Candidatus Ruania gallistercoris TaxID=2838746 RepID=A0A9D2ECR6_9MICO|nr:NAD(P)/FAD-dependent oxidoreductase [Candidatus Ruania gallistercoris]
MSAEPTSTEVLVVGGGPIGLAAAIEARRAGWDTVVVEPRSTPIDKACGEGLMPGAVRALHQLGVDPPGHPIAGISYRDGRQRADHRFRSGPGRGVRRTVLQQALAVRVQQLGIPMVRARAERVDAEPGGVLAAGISARWLLACDGLHSPTRRRLGLDQPHSRARSRRRFGIRQHFRVPAWTSLVEVHWGSGVEAYVTPVGVDEVGVALLGPPGLDYQAELARFPELSARLRGAHPLGPVRGAGPLRQRSRRRTAGPVRLVGDASGYVDALTGEGIRVGLAQARAAVATLEQNSSAYEREWSRATRSYRVLTSGLVRWASSPARGAIVAVATRLPGLYGAIVDRLAQ